MSISCQPASVSAAISLCNKDSTFLFLRFSSARRHKNNRLHWRNLLLFNLAVAMIHAVLYYIRKQSATLERVALRPARVFFWSSPPSSPAEVTPLRCREMVLGDSHNEHDRAHSINLRPGAFWAQISEMLKPTCLSPSVISTVTSPSPDGSQLLQN